MEMKERRKHKRSLFGREERWFLFKVSLLVLLVYLFRKEISQYSKPLIFLLPLFLIFALVAKTLTSSESISSVLKKHITLIPFMHAEGEEKPFIPRLTILLVLFNILVHYLLKLLPTPEWASVVGRLGFVPIVKTWWTAIISPVTSMFIHSSQGHLWGNMAFLWAFGPAVEERVGRRWFIILYLLTGVTGSLIELFIYQQFLNTEVFGLGASGAISGIMGVFMVRCYFKKVIIPLPFFGIFKYRLHINSLIPLGFFLLRDVMGGARQLEGSGSSIGYWGHIGSIVTGALFAFVFKQHNAALREKYTSLGIKALDDPNCSMDGEGALNHALELDPKNEAAILALARKKARYRHAEGREFFEKVIQLKLRNHPKEAAELYKEYLSVYNTMLAPSLQYRLSEILNRQGDFEGAVRSLEMIVDSTAVSAPTQEKAFNQLVSLLVEGGLNEPARHRLSQFESRFPTSSMLPVVRKKVGFSSN